MPESFHKLPSVSAESGARLAPRVAISPVSMPLPVSVSNLNVSSQPGPPVFSPLFTPVTVLKALGHCWKTALPIGLVLGVIAAGVTWVMRPNKVSSVALIRVAPASSVRVLSDTAPPQENDSAYMRTQLSMIGSPPVLRDVIRDEAIKNLPTIRQQGDALSWMTRNLQVQQVDNTELIRLTLNHRGDGEDLATILNAIVSSYLATLDRTEHAKELAHLAELQTIYEKGEDNLRKLRVSLNKEVTTLKSADSQILNLKQQTLVNEYSSLKQELARNNTRRRELDVKRSGLRQKVEAYSKVKPATGEDVAADPQVEREIDADARVVAQQTKVHGLEEKLQLTRESVADPKGHPSVVKLEQDVAAAKILLETARSDRRKSLLVRYNSAALAAAEAALGEATVEYDLLTKHINEMTGELATMKSEMDSFGIDSHKLLNVRSEIEQLEVFNKTIWEQKERLNVELNGRNRQRVSALSPAEEGQVLNPLGRLQETAGMGFGGLLLGLVGTSLWFASKGAIYGTKEITQGLQLNVMGTIPVFSSASPMPLQKPSFQDESVDELGLIDSVDGIRTRLLNTRFGTKCPILMIASPSPGEGKTTLSIQLAGSLARAGYRTLLIDCDLRSPSLDRNFGLPLSPGFSDLLVDSNGPELEASWVENSVIPALRDKHYSSLVHTIGDSQLDVITAGKFDSRAAAGLARQHVNHLLTEMRDDYDFILIDSSPLLAVPDGVMIGRFVDGVLFSARTGVSRATDIYAGYVHSSVNRLPFIGVVVNGVKLKEPYNMGNYRRND